VPSSARDRDTPQVDPPRRPELDRERNPERRPTPTQTRAAPPTASASATPEPSPSVPVQQACGCPLSGVRIDAGRVDAAMGLRGMTLTLTNCGKMSRMVNGYRSCGLSRSEPTQPHAPNGLGRTGPRRTRPRGSDTHPVRGPIPGGQFPARSGHMGAARGDGEALNHHSGGAGAPHAGTVLGVPDRTITVARTAQATASPEADHHTIELNRPRACSPASSWQPLDIGPENTLGTTAGTPPS
jgi:hypothetical protein